MRRLLKYRVACLYAIVIFLKTREGYGKTQKNEEKVGDQMMISTAHMNICLQVLLHSCSLYGGPYGSAVGLYYFSFL